jgi:uncharacterized membrane protein YhaH (DUF805 family)
MKYYIRAWQKCLTFHGRASRSEYWYFTDLVYIGLYLMPMICVGVRRMQDVNKTGWHLMIPVYGIILALEDGKEADNKYGPKANWVP